jgi:hypothetical protein
MSSTSPNKFPSIAEIKTQLFQRQSQTARSQIQDSIKGKTISQILLQKKMFGLVVFQNMFLLSLSEIFDFMSSPYNRVSTSKQTSLDAYKPQISSNGLLNNQVAREGNLNFLLERYARQNPIDLQDPTQPFTKENFYANVSKIQDLRLQLLGNTKVNRAIIGFRDASKIFHNETIGNRYVEKRLPPKSINSKMEFYGIIQTLNGLVNQSIDIRKNLGTAIPESITSTCFELPSKLKNSSYNPLDNKILNLGKNLFDFDGGIVATSSLDGSDITRWKEAMLNFNTKKETNTDLWETGKYYTPTKEQVESITPKFENVWALSQHFLYQSPSIDTYKLNDSDNCLNVRYALYTDNHITRPLETSPLAENTQGDVCTSLYPYIKTYENPSMLTWFTIDDVVRMVDTIKSQTNFDESTKDKIKKATVFHRYINQNTFPISNQANMEEIELLDAKVIQTKFVRIENEQTSDKDATYGGEFSINIFEKNFKILSESSNNVRLDAINLVADDNAKFMDVRLPPTLYASINSKGQLTQKDYPIDYALGYSTNSNVVLLAKSEKNSVGFFDVGIQNGCSETNRSKLNTFWNTLNNNKNFTISNGDGQAINIKIDRRTPISPKRMIFDTYYTLTLDWMYKYNKILRDFGSTRQWAKIDELSRPYREKILASSLLNPSNNKSFYTPFNEASNKMFINVLRGVLYNPQTLKENDENGFRNITRSRDFLTSIPESSIKSSDMLVDSVFYVNQSNYKPFTEKLDTLPPIDAKTNDPFTYRGILPSYSAYHHSERLNLPPTANLDATIPFLPNGITTLNQINAPQKNQIQSQPSSLGSDCYARCFDPMLNKAKTLETLHYYHTASLNNGAPLGTLDQGVAQGKSFFKDTKPFVINPYSCDLVNSTLPLISIGNGFNTVRCYETRTLLRKEYYANRFVALLGMYLSRLLENTQINIQTIQTNGNQTINVYYENVLGNIALAFLDSFKMLSGRPSFSYFENQLKDKNGLINSIGNNLIKMCFFETKPFEQLIVSKYGNMYNFVYINSKIKDIKACINSGFADKMFNTKDGMRLLEYVIDSQGYRPTYSNEITAEQVEKARYFICSLDEKGITNLKEEYVKYELSSSIAALTLAVPTYELPQEIKDFLCSKGKKQIPMLPTENSLKMIDYLAKQYADAGVDLEAKLRKLNCSNTSDQDVSDESSDQSTRQDTHLISAEDSSKLPSFIQMDDVDTKTQTMSNNIQSKTKSNAMLYTVGFLGLASLSYVTYRYQKSKKRM